MSSSVTGLQTQTRPGAAGLLLSSQQGTCSAWAQTAARLSFRSASRRRQAAGIKTTTSGMAFQFNPKSKGKVFLCDIAPSQQDQRMYLRVHNETDTILSLYITFNVFVLSWIRNGSFQPITGQE